MAIIETDSSIRKPLRQRYIPAKNLLGSRQIIENNLVRDFLAALWRESDGVNSEVLRTRITLNAGVVHEG